MFVTPHCRKHYKISDCNSSNDRICHFRNATTLIITPQCKKHSRDTWPQSPQCKKHSHDTWPQSPQCKKHSHYTWPQSQQLQCLSAIQKPQGGKPSKLNTASTRVCCGSISGVLVTTRHLTDMFHRSSPIWVCCGSISGVLVTTRHRTDMFHRSSPMWVWRKTSLQLHTVQELKKKGNRLLPHFCSMTSSSSSSHFVACKSKAGRSDIF